MKKYADSSFPPTMINKDIIDNVEEGILLLDQDLNIVFKNRPLLNTLDLKEEDIIGLRNIVVENTILYNGLSDLIRTDRSSL